MLKRKGSKEDDTINLIVANEEKSDNYGSLAKEDEDEDWDDTDDETSDDTLEEVGIVDLFTLLLIYIQFPVIFGSKLNELII